MDTFQRSLERQNFALSHTDNLPVVQTQTYTMQLREKCIKYHRNLLQKFLKYLWQIQIIQYCNVNNP